MLPPAVIPLKSIYPSEQAMVNPLSVVITCGFISLYPKYQLSPLEIAVPINPFPRVVGWI